MGSLQAKITHLQTGRGKAGCAMEMKYDSCTTTDPVGKQGVLEWLCAAKFHDQQLSVPGLTSCQIVCECSLLKTDVLGSEALPHAWVMLFWIDKEAV